MACWQLRGINKGTSTTAILPGESYRTDEPHSDERERQQKQKPRGIYSYVGPHAIDPCTDHACPSCVEIRCPEIRFCLGMDMKEQSLWSRKKKSPLMTL